MLENPTNSCQLVDAVGIIIFGSKLCTLPDPAYFTKPSAQGIGRDGDATIDFELGSQGGTTPTCATPAESQRCGLEQRQQGASLRKATNKWCAGAAADSHHQ